MFSRKPKVSNKAFCVLSSGIGSTNGCSFEAAKNITLAKVILGVGGSATADRTDAWEYATLSDVHGLRTELAHGSDLSTFYDLVIIYCPSENVYKRHSKDLVALSTDLPFVVVCEAFVGAPQCPKVAMVSSMKPLLGGSMGDDSEDAEGFVLFAVLSEVARILKDAQTTNNSKNNPTSTAIPSSGVAALNLAAIAKALAPLTPSANAIVYKEASSKGDSQSAGAKTALVGSIPQLCDYAALVKVGASSSSLLQYEAETNCPIWSVIVSLPCWEGGAFMAKNGYGSNAAANALTNVSGGSGPSDLVSPSTSASSAGCRIRPASGAAVLEVRVELAYDSQFADEAGLKRALIAELQQQQQQGATAPAPLLAAGGSGLLVANIGNGIFQIVSSEPSASTAATALFAAVLALNNNSAILHDFSVSCISQCFTLQVTGSPHVLCRQERLMRGGFTDPSSQLRIEDLSLIVVEGNTSRSVSGGTAVIAKAGSNTFSVGGGGSGANSRAASVPPSPANNNHNSSTAAPAPLATMDGSSFGSTESANLALMSSNMARAPSTSVGAFNPSEESAGGASSALYGVPSMPSPPASQRYAQYQQQTPQQQQQPPQQVQQPLYQNQFAAAPFASGNPAPQPPLLSNPLVVPSSANRTPSAVAEPTIPIAEVDARIEAALQRQQQGFAQQLADQRAAMEQQYKAALERGIAAAKSEVLATAAANAAAAVSAAIAAIPPPPSLPVPTPANSAFGPMATSQPPSRSASMFAGPGADHQTPAGVRMLVESECTRLVAPLYERLAHDYHTKERFQEVANEIVEKIPKKDQVAGLISSKISAAAVETNNSIATAINGLREELQLHVQSAVQDVNLSVQTSLASANAQMIAGLNTNIATSVANAVQKQQNDVSAAISRLRDEVNASQQTIQAQVQQCAQQQSQLHTQQQQLATNVASMGNTLSTTIARVSPTPSTLATPAAAAASNAHTFPSPNCVTDTVFNTAVGSLNATVETMGRDLQRATSQLHDVQQQLREANEALTSRTEVLKARADGIEGRVGYVEQQQHELAMRQPQPAAAITAAGSPSNGPQIAMLQFKLQSLEDQLSSVLQQQQEQQSLLRITAAKDAALGQHSSPQQQQHGQTPATARALAMMPSPIARVGSAPSSVAVVGGTRQRAVSSGAMSSAADAATPATMADLRKYARRVDMDTRVDAMRVALNRITDNFKVEINGRIEASEARMADTFGAMLEEYNATQQQQQQLNSANPSKPSPYTSPNRQRGSPSSPTGVDAPTRSEVQEGHDRLWANVEALVQEAKSSTLTTVKANVGQLRAELSDLAQKYAVLKAATANANANAERSYSNAAASSTATDVQQQQQQQTFVIARLQEQVARLEEDVQQQQQQQNNNATPTRRSSQQQQQADGLLLSPRFEEVAAIKAQCDDNADAIRLVKDRVERVEVQQLSLEPLLANEDQHLRALRKMLDRLQRLEQNAGLSTVTSRAPSPQAGGGGGGGLATAASNASSLMYGGSAGHGNGSFLIPTLSTLSNQQQNMLNISGSSMTAAPTAAAAGGTVPSSQPPTPSSNTYVVGGGLTASSSASQPASAQQTPRKAPTIPSHRPPNPNSGTRQPSPVLPLQH